MAITILRLPTVQKRTGLSRSSIYLRMENKNFPLSISLGGRSVGWIESEIEEWLQQQISKSRSNENDTASGLHPVILKNPSSLSMSFIIFARKLISLLFFD